MSRAAVGFGIPGTLTGDRNFQAWLAVKSVRDIASGVFVFVLLVGAHLLGWFTLAAAGIPLGDALVVLRSKGSKVVVVVGDCVCWCAWFGGWIPDLLWARVVLSSVSASVDVVSGCCTCCSVPVSRKMSDPCRSVCIGGFSRSGDAWSVLPLRVGGRVVTPTPLA